MAGVPPGSRAALVIIIIAILCSCPLEGPWLCSTTSSSSPGRFLRGRPLEQGREPMLIRSSTGVGPLLLINQLFQIVDAIGSTLLYKPILLPVHRALQLVASNARRFVQLRPRVLRLAALGHASLSRLRALASIGMAGSIHKHRAIVRYLARIVEGVVIQHQLRVVPLLLAGDSTRARAAVAGRLAFLFGKSGAVLRLPAQEVGGCG